MKERKREREKKPIIKVKLHLQARNLLVYYITFLDNKSSVRRNPSREKKRRTQKVLVLKKKSHQDKGQIELLKNFQNMETKRTVFLQTL